MSDVKEAHTDFGAATANGALTVAQLQALRSILSPLGQLAPGLAERAVGYVVSGEPADLLTTLPEPGDPTQRLPSKWALHDKTAQFESDHAFFGEGRILKRLSANR